MFKKSNVLIQEIIAVKAYFIQRKMPIYIGEFMHAIKCFCCFESMLKSTMFRCIVIFMNFMKTIWEIVKQQELEGIKKNVTDYNRSGICLINTILKYICNQPLCEIETGRMSVQVLIYSLECIAIREKITAKRGPESGVKSNDEIDRDTLSDMHVSTLSKTSVKLASMFTKQGNMKEIIYFHKSIKG